MENKLPLISIIVPMHNAEKYIQRCVESIKKQTYTNYELILIDDHSTDNTLQICKDTYGDCKTIVISNRQKKGVSSARNSGIDRANGEYLTFVDADDIVNPIFLNTLYEIHCQHSDYLSMCRLVEFSDKTPEFKDDDNLQVMSITAKSFLANIYFYHPSACACLFRNDLIKKYKIRFEEDCSFCEDDYFTSKYMTFCKGAAISERRLYGYFVNLCGIGAHKDHDKLTLKDVNHRAESFVGLKDALKFTSYYNTSVSKYIKAGYVFIAADIILTAERAREKNFLYKKEINDCLSFKNCWEFIRFGKSKKQVLFVIGIVINPRIARFLLDCIEKK